MRLNGQESLHHPNDAAQTHDSQGREPEVRMLLDRLTQGDHMAFWALWMQHQKYFYRICLRHMNGVIADAEDAYSRAMIKAWEKLPEQANKINNPKAWLARLTHNLCVDIQRERQRRARFVESLEDISFSNKLPTNLIATPEDVSVQEEMSRYLRCLVGNLSPNLREPFVLRFLFEMPYSEIAARLRLSNENVRKRIQQARALLRERWMEYEVGLQEQPCSCDTSIIFKDHL